MKTKVMRFRLMSIELSFAMVILITSLTACGGGSSSSNSSEQPIAKQPTPKQELSFNSDFSNTNQSFEIDAADHQVEHSLNQFIISELVQLPSPYEYRNGIEFSWNNYNEDIKGFIKKKVSGLNPNSQFIVEFSVNILTFMSEECLGIGGSPGKDVIVKASLLAQEPLKYIDDSGLFPFYRVDIDENLYGGDDVNYLGHIGLPVPCDDVFLHQDPIWEIKHLTNEDNVSFSSGATGDAWIYVSIDSGVGGHQKVYITDVEVKVSEL